MTNSFREFDPMAIRASLEPDTTALLRQLTVLEMVDSTNLYLMRLSGAQQHGHAVVANQQQSGRGRRGRVWHSPPGGNIYLSLGWQLAKATDAFMQLPLMVAVVLARALQHAGVVDAGIKWPNDILVDGKKLAGILLESRHDEKGRVVVVIGIGVNVCMPLNTLKRKPIDQAWTDVSSHLAGPLGEDFRDRLCGMLLDELVRGLALFDSCGFAAFSAEWALLDILHGRPIEISVGDQPTLETVSGTAAGISDRGGLMVRCPGPYGENTIREFLAGDVSVRLS